MVKFSKKIGALSLGLALVFSFGLFVAGNRVVFAATAPSGPCQNNSSSLGAATWVWVSGSLYGCPIGAVPQNWTQMYPVISANLNPDTVQTAVVSLSAAQLIAMNATPQAILPTPTAGTAILVDKISLEMTTTSTQFTGGGVVSFVYHGGAVSVVTSTIPAAVVTTTAGTTVTMLGPLTTTNGATITQAAGVDITNATAAFAAGTGTAKVFIQYRIITL